MPRWCFLHVALLKGITMDKLMFTKDEVQLLISKAFEAGCDFIISVEHSFGDEEEAKKIALSEITAELLKN